MKIAINHARCLRKKFTKVTCSACMECPAKSINENLEVDNGCIDCGLCLANCPVEAIAGSNYALEPIRQLISREAPIQLSCKKCQPESPWPCLGFIDPILLLTFVYSGTDTNREVAIYQEECASCNPDVARHIARTVEEANRLLGPDKNAIVSSSQKCSGKALQAVSRRKFFAELWGASVSTVREVAFPASDRLDPIPRRELFLTHNGASLMPSRMNNQTTFQTLTIDKSCKACGLCSKMCSSGALTTILDGEALEIKQNPALCNNCGVCVAQCPQGALSLLHANSINEKIIGRVGLPVCTDCGNVYQPIGRASLCLDCMRKTKLL